MLMENRQKSQQKLIQNKLMNQKDSSSIPMPKTENVHCNLCGGRSITTIYDQVTRIDTPDTKVVQCTRCGLVYLSPRLKELADNFTMNEAYLRQFYLPMYQQMGLLSVEGKLITEINTNFHRYYLDGLAPYRSNNRMLDIGCAIGLFLAAAKVNGWDVYGLDPSAPLSAYGRETIGVNVLHAELQELEFPNDYFDVVTLWNVVEHLLDPTAVLSEVHRVLRPGGRLIIQVPNWSDIARDILGPTWDMFVTDHFYYFTPTTLSKLVVKNGFTVEKFDAAELVASEIEEITSKVSAQAAADALQTLKRSGATDRGSTITLYANKLTTTNDRLGKAWQLIHAGNLQQLTKEVRDYIKWKLSTTRS